MFTRDSKILSRVLTVPITSVSRAIGNVFDSSFNKLIKSLFANNEQGFAYDPNDLSTMFQDAAGTVPVTGVGQAVGLMLDKSKGLVLGAELWNDSIVAPTGGSSKISNGVYRIYSSDGAYSAINIGGVLTVGALYKLTFNIDSITLLGTGITNEGNPASIFNSLGKKTVYFFATAAALSLKRAGGACDIQISNVSVKPVAGNHTYQTTSASRPILRQNAVTGAYYLDFDGADDFFVTNNIDFTSTDKVSLFAGVRKLSDTATGTVLELSPSKNTNTGVFSLFAPLDSGAAQIAWVSKGTTERATAVDVAAAPVSTVISAKGNISGGVSQLRIDGVTNANNAGSQGTGNYGNYPLYIGRRAGTSLPFSGHIYGLIGIGRLTTDSETKALEKAIAKNTGVTLNV